MPLPPGAPSPAPLFPGQLGKILTGTVVLAILYIGREVLVPITLAVILSLLIAPLVRALKRTGLGQAGAALGAVAVLTIVFVGLALVIGLQVVAMASSLPQYEATIRSKLRVVEAATLGRLEQVQGEAGRAISRLSDPGDDDAAGPGGAQARANQADRAATARLTTTPGVVPVEIRERPPTAARLVSQVFTSVWGPLGETGIVLVVLVFVLLEHESLRDRFIRLIGVADLQGTTRALNDAGERLSRFFVSQFTVNVGVGIGVGIGLFAIGLPHAMFWAVLTTVLRFVPYVGVLAAALSAGLLAAAVDPGWGLVLMTLGLFAIVEVIASQVVEPQLYGHTTGLSPLSIVLSAIFWSWIWGPIGLLVSTPLTLCLVVAGRHVEALAFLDVLLGNTPALTLSQRFYQRALSGDADEIIAAARAYLKRKSFASYCDAILMPALRLGAADLETGRIAPEQQRLVRGAIAQVIEALGPEARRRSRWHRRVSVLDEPNLGLHLRHQREDINGQFQGPLAVPLGSIILCVGLGSMRDDLVTEILVRVLRDSDIDARHLSLAELEAGPPPGAVPGTVAMVFLVSAFPREEEQQAIVAAAHIRRRFPKAGLVGAIPSLLSAAAEKPALASHVDRFATSFEEALHLAANRG